MFGLLSSFFQALLGHLVSFEINPGRFLKLINQVFYDTVIKLVTARLAAVGLLIIRYSSRPAILPASFVACLWASVKYAGTVITA